MLVQYTLETYLGVLVDTSVVDTYVCMSVWSTFSADFGSTGYGSQSFSWSAEKGSKSFSLSPFAPENVVSRDELGCPVPRQLACYLPHSG